MKKIILTFWILLFPFFVFSYQQQGFSQYQENLWSMDFVCESQCLTLIWEKDAYDWLDINWQIDGQWILWYGFLVEQQIIPWEILQINGSTNINQNFIFSQSPYFQQIPNWSQIMLIVEGNIRWTLNPELSFQSFWEKTQMGWKDFWTFDTFKPYTINLLRWPMIFNKSANWILYVIFIIFSLIILFFIKKPLNKKLKYIWLWLLSLLLIYELRMWLEMMNYYKNDYNTYISQSWYEKVYRDRGDFYSFVDFSTNTLSKMELPKFQSISFYTDNTWPFPGSMKYFLYPYDIEVNLHQSNYFIVYWYQNFERTWSTLILSGINLWAWTFYDFSPSAFIFVK